MQEGANGHFLVARFTANGSLDETFGTAGKTVIDIRTYNEAFTCALQKDGKIVLGGQAKFITQTAYGIARVDANGKVDSSFAVNGKSYTAFKGSNEPEAIALQADGKIVFTGSNNDIGDIEYATLRYKTDGTVDSTFGDNGMVRVSIGAVNFARSIAIQPDGKIVIGGQASFNLPEVAAGAATTTGDFCVIRLLSFNPLPVQFTTFTGKAVKAGVELNWATATETNSSHFIIERSNGGSFNAIGRVNSSGNTNQLQQYSYIDVKPLAGENFYRLQQVDKDGRFAYSKIVRVVYGDGPYLTAYPNPAKTVVKISGLSAGTYLTLVTAGGKVVNQYRATGNNYTLNVQNLTVGVYFIRVQQNGKTTTLKVVKE